MCAVQYFRSRKVLTMLLNGSNLGNRGRQTQSSDQKLAHTNPEALLFVPSALRKDPQCARSPRRNKVTLDELVEWASAGRDHAIHQQVLKRSADFEESGIDTQSEFKLRRSDSMISISHRHMIARRIPNSELSDHACPPSLNSGRRLIQLLHVRLICNNYEKAI